MQESQAEQLERIALEREAAKTKLVEAQIELRKSQQTNAEPKSKPELA